MFDVGLVLIDSQCVTLGRLAPQFGEHRGLLYNVKVQLKRLLYLIPHINLFPVETGSSELFLCLYDRDSKGCKGRERRDNMQQMTTGRSRTPVSCGKASAFIHGAHALPGKLYQRPNTEMF